MGQALPTRTAKIGTISIPKTMRAFQIYLILAATMLFAGPGARGAGYSNELQNVSQAVTAAVPALVTLKSLGYKDLSGTGFSTTNEIPMAVNGEPIPIYRVPFPALSEYQPTNSLETLMPVDVRTQSAKHLIFPVKVGPKVRSAITMRWDGMNWRADKLGRPDLIRRLTDTLSTVPAASRAPVQPFAVEIELFDIWLIGYFNHLDQLVLLATRDLTSGPLTVAANNPMTAAMMFRFASTAQRYNFKPN